MWAPLFCSKTQMEGTHSPSCPSLEQSPQKPSSAVPHSLLSPGKQTMKVFIGFIKNRRCHEETHFLMFFIWNENSGVWPQFRRGRWQACGRSFAGPCDFGIWAAWHCCPSTGFCRTKLAHDTFHCRNRHFKSHPKLAYIHFCMPDVTQT